jgi:predicted RNA-binding protein Jag
MSLNKQENDNNTNQYYVTNSINKTRTYPCPIRFLPQLVAMDLTRGNSDNLESVRQLSYTSQPTGTQEHRLSLLSDRYDTRSETEYKSKASGSPTIFSLERQDPRQDLIQEGHTSISQDASGAFRSSDDNRHYQERSSLLHHKSLERFQVNRIYEGASARMHPPFSLQNNESQMENVSQIPRIRASSIPLVHVKDNKKIQQVSKHKCQMTVPKPKRPLTAYNFFFKDQRAILLKAKNERNVNLIGTTNTGFEEMAKTISSRWKNIDTELKRQYAEKADCEKKRYCLEMEMYKEKKSQELTALQKELENSVSKDAIRMYLACEGKASHRHSAED